MNKSSLIVVLIAATTAVFVRLVPTPLASFSAISSLAILAGTAIRPAWLAVLVPITVRLLTDFRIHLSTGYGFYDSMVFDYGAYALMTGISYAIQPRTHFQAAGMGLLSTIVFFVVSNFGVWCLPYGGQYLYPLTLRGLMDCYWNGLPFLRGSAISDVLFTICFIAVLQSVSVPSAQLVRVEAA